MMFRLLFRKFLEGRGYTRSQAKRVIAKLDWAKVREIIREYGPTLLKIFLALLPLILEPPHTMQIAEPGSEEEDYDFDFNEKLFSPQLEESLPLAEATQEHGIPICICYLNLECQVHGGNFIKPGTCKLPPDHLFCTKEEGHEGPCPTYKK